MARDPVRAAREYWERCRGDRKMPARADLDPAEMKVFLPHIILWDVLRDPLDFRYRLVGSEVERNSHQRNLGRRLSEIPERQPGSQVWENLKAVVETKEPSERQLPYVGPFKDFKTVRQVTLPLSDDGETVNIVMLVCEFVPIAGAEADDVGEAGARGAVG